jgi:pimeloyl-ACP methyl ester carboxylesterase
MLAGMTTAIESGHAPVGGLQLYYEIRGSGEPLVVLHGAIGSMLMFGPNLERFAAGRRVISVDLQGHGYTGDVDRPLTYEAMADDVAALLDHLDIRQADVLGYSLGGGVALHTGARHRDRVRRLVLASIAMRRRDYFPEILASFDALGPAAAPAMKRSAFHAHYAKASPRPDFPALLGKVGALIQTDYDWTPLVPALPPTLLAVGDADAMRLSTVVDAFVLLGGSLRDPGWDGAGGRTPSRLAILPGVSHYDMAVSPALAAAVDGFLAPGR